MIEKRDSKIENVVLVGVITKEQNEERMMVNNRCFIIIKILGINIVILKLTNNLKNQKTINKNLFFIIP